MVSALISLISALFKAIPSLGKIFAEAVALSNKGNEADAISRKLAKDKAIDAAFESKEKDGDTQ